MSRVMLAKRKFFLVQQLSNYNRIAMRLSQKLHDLHKYSASIARGFMTPFALAGMPLSCLTMAGNYFFNQFGPQVRQNVATRVFNATSGSPNPNYQKLAMTDDEIQKKFNEIAGNPTWSGDTMQNIGGFSSPFALPGLNPNTPAFRAISGGRPVANAVAGTTPQQDALTNEQLDSAKRHMVEAAYKAEMQEIRKAEEENIKVIEDEIVQEQQLNNTRIEVTKTELKEVEQGEKNAIEREKSIYA